MSELNAFDSLLGGPWSDSSETVPLFPKPSSTIFVQRVGANVHVVEVVSAWTRRIFVRGKTAGHITLIILFVSVRHAIVNMTLRTAFRRKNCRRSRIA